MGKCGLGEEEEEKVGEEKVEEKEEEEKVGEEKVEEEEEEVGKEGVEKQALMSTQHI